MLKKTLFIVAMIFGCMALVNSKEKSNLNSFENESIRIDIEGCNQITTEQVHCDMMDQ